MAALTNREKIDLQKSFTFTKTISHNSFCSLFGGQVCYLFHNLIVKLIIVYAKSCLLKSRKFHNFKGSSNFCSVPAPCEVGSS